MSDDVVMVFMTAADRAEARRLADMLVDRRLAACVQIMPEMESVYRWQGKIERQPEVLLIAKTVRGKFAELEAQVRSVHSYEIPEIVAVPLTAGSRSYVDWLSASVTKDQRED